VQVQFDWQKRSGKNTNWIRVQSPDAGGSGVANRGMVFIPEEGDQVMVGFEYGNPNRPYVMGSLFSGSTGKGGETDNHIHSIVTKSGRQIILDDSDEGGIIISDSKGNTINISTSGGNIEIVATNEISLHSKTIRIEADEDIFVKSGKNFEKNIGGNSSVAVEGEAKKDVKGSFTETVEKNKESIIKGKYNLSVEKDHVHNVSGKMEVTVGKDCETEISGKLSCESTKDTTINSKSKLYVTGGGSVYVGK
jgi:uncharacterized protein involved in type VI secretion and phage assembly